MRDGIKIGRIFGIAIQIDPSWFLIFLLVTWNLSGSFLRTHPGWGVGANLALAVAGALLFFGSVLVHELAHSVVAIAQGIPVKNITLFLFGGVANIQREPPSPRAEFLITIVGPLASFLLGILFFALTGVLERVVAVTTNPEALLAQLDPFATMLLWLGSINFLLAVFNLIPGFPLDGGRVLRAALWALSGNLRRATYWSSLVGQTVGWLFIVAGIAMIFGTALPFFGAGAISGIWLAFIGWFLKNAAVQSYRQVVVQDLLAGVPVERLTRSNVPTVTPDTLVNALVEDHVMAHDERALPVIRQEQLVGLVCFEDIRRVPRESWPVTTAGQIMTPIDNLVVATPDEDVSDALSKLAHRDVSQMPVVQGGRFVGLLRRRDIARWLELQAEGR